MEIIPAKRAIPHRIASPDYVILNGTGDVTPDEFQRFSIPQEQMAELCYAYFHKAGCDTHT